MKGLVIALQFLTRLPMPRVHADEHDFARSMRWFPAAGLVIGALLAAAAVFGFLVDSWTAALCALLLWVWVTGGLHLDGLSDLADARGAAHKDRAHFLAVMADPHVGNFGVTAIVLQLFTKLVLLHGVIETGSLVAPIFIPFAARIGPLVWTLWLPPLHAGLGARFATGIAPRHLLLWALPLGASALAVPVLLAAPALILLWGWWLKRCVGGVSGDCHGAGIELVETGLLAALLIAHHL